MKTYCKHNFIELAKSPSINTITSVVKERTLPRALCVKPKFHVNVIVTQIWLKVETCKATDDFRVPCLSFMTVCSVLLYDQSVTYIVFLVLSYITYYPCLLSVRLCCITLHPKGQGSSVCQLHHLTSNLSGNTTLRKISSSKIYHIVLRNIKTKHNERLLGKTYLTHQAVHFHAVSSADLIHGRSRHRRLFMTQAKYFSR